MTRIFSLPPRSVPWRALTMSLATALLLGQMALPRDAAAQSGAEMRALTDQVERLQRELNVLQRNVYQGQGQPRAPGGAVTGDPGRLADLQIRLDDMDARISQLVGQIEETNHRIATMEQRFERFSSDMDMRLSAGAPQTGAAPQAAAPAIAAGQPERPLLIPPRGAGDPSQTPSAGGNLGTLSQNDPQTRGTDAMAADAAARAAQQPSAAASGGAPLPAGTPDEQYKYAFGLLSRADYPGAERALTAFVETHPTHSLAGNAQYWLGESYYVRNDFNQAARAFAIGYQKYPKSAKAPDNLLKLGLSLGNLNKSKEACQSYALLKKDFPKAAPEILRRAEGEQKRLRCA